MVNDAVTSAPGVREDLLLTAFVIIDEKGVVTASNPLAEHLLGEGAVGHRFFSRLSEASKFGLISKAAIARMASGIETGASSFRTEDGRTFVLRSAQYGSSKRIEWTDASVISVTDEDPATGLLTRQGFLAAIDGIAQQTPPLFVVHLSLDNFKDLDDLFGQVTVDHLIRRVTERISGQVDASAARLAHGLGAEFFFILPGYDASQLAAVTLEILARAYLVDGKMIHCTASIGMAVGANGDDAETTLRNAGLALKQARAGGGNQICAFTADMRQAMQRKRDLEIDLRKALALREFSLVYQPQYRIAGRQLVGFEALLRWNHPAHGSVSPAEFVPLAEELGLIVPLGEWVLKTACKKAAAWPSNLSISVNVSPLQFRNPSITSTVTSALANSGLEPSRLDLEITEGAVLMNSGPILETFRQLKAIGVRFSMDDFGTGFSSLSYLQKFPFDKIKIDQSFVRSLAASRDSRAIIRAICALGNSLGLTTIAEGVETEDQLKLVQKKGCLQVQGYLTGRPLTPELADQLVATSYETNESADP
jgi:diguanylate cyclase (GGDEF)-like protein